MNNKLYAEVLDNTINRVNIKLPTTIQGVSIPAGASDLQRFNLYEITGSEPAYDSSTQRLTGPTYQVQADTVLRVYTVEQIPQEELAASLQASVVQATQQRLDDFAKTRNYDGILSACTYATSTALKFQGEGQYAVNARDNTWSTLYQIMQDVQSGTRPIPSGFSGIEPLLPPLEWPV